MSEARSAIRFGAGDQTPQRFGAVHNIGVSE